MKVDLNVGEHNVLNLRRLGIDTSQEHVIFMHKESPVCRAEGFSAQARIRVHYGKQSIIATLQIVNSEILSPAEAGLSESAWQDLGAVEGQRVWVSHPEAVESMSLVRAKIYGKKLESGSFRAIISDIVEGQYTDVDIAAFVTACSDDHLSLEEIISLTNAMIAVGERLQWPHSPVVDKHCVGGLPGNRTTMVIVPIIAAHGLLIPKTSSRSITSPAGTADAMETVAPVNLDSRQMKKVVEKEGGCIIWGGAIGLSPADDILIRVERALDLDSEGQLIASILSKKAAAGSTHVLVDIPVGLTAKLRSNEAAESLAKLLKTVGKTIGLQVEAVITDGSQPVGCGIGPALEARDVLKVLMNEKDAPQDLKERSLLLAGKIMELADSVSKGEGYKTAMILLEKGKAWGKFQAICEAQGGMQEPPIAKYQKDVVSECDGSILSIDNRRLAKVAKLAGAPHAKAAGVYLHAPLDTKVSKNQPLFTIHAESPGEIDYALTFVEAHEKIINVGGKK